MERQQSSSQFKEQFIVEPSEAYNARRNYVRSSGLKVALACAEKYHHEYVSDREVKEEEESKALRFGRLMHMALLEPVRTRERIKVGPANAPRNTNVGKAKWEEFYATLSPDSIVMDAKEADLALGMISRLMRDPYVPSIFTKGIAERSGYYLDEATGLECMFRPDYIVEYENLIDIYDYKTTTDDASYDGFQYTIDKYEYDVSAAHYVAGAERLKKKKVYFHWVVQEKQAPFVVGIYTATKELLDIGEYKRRQALERIASCTKSGKWPAYTDGPVNMAPSKRAAWQQLEREERALND